MSIRSHRRRVRNRWLVLALALSLLAVAALVLTRNWRQQHPRGLVIVTFDALRGDHLGFNGYRRNTSPNLDAFARQAVSFTRARSQGTHTPPAMTSLFTGTYVHTHGVADFNDDKINSLPRDLSRVLREAGFATAFISGHGGLARFADSLGFEQYTSAALSAEEVTRKGLAWLRRNKQRRFLLHLHYLEPHHGATLSSRYTEFFSGDGLDQTSERLPAGTIGLVHVRGHADPDGTLDVAKVIRRYDGAIRFADKKFGAVLTTLDKLGLQDSTVVVVSTDHGEYLGEGNVFTPGKRYFAHGGAPAELLTRVPLLVRVPGVAAARVDTPAQLIDVMPTVLAELGLPCPKTVQGQSLAGVLRGGSLARRFTFSGDITASSLAIWSGDWKLVYQADQGRDGSHSLFNVSRRPWEQQDQAKANPRLFNELKAELDLFINAEARKSKTVKQIRDTRTRSQLRSLGYIK